MINFTELGKLTKAAIKEKLDSHAGEYPKLTTIDPDTMTKKEMLLSAREILAADPEPKAEDKVDALRNVLTAKPNAVVVPAQQAILRLKHPTIPDEQFEISIMPPDDDGAMRILELSSLRRKWAEPEERKPRREVNKIHGTLLSDVPKWAIEEVYNRIQEGHLRVYQDQTEAQETYSREHDLSRKAGTLLDVELGDIGMKVVRAQGTGMSEDYQPVVVEPKGKFTRPEQEAAWNVLNSTVQGEAPLPVVDDEVSPDPRQVSTQEILHVRSRINRCLENPSAFTDKQITGGFEKRIFFNQLLECEFSGYTPRRPGSQNKSGGFRPAILRVIREMADTEGYEVIGDYVAPKMSREIKADLVPTIPLTNRP